MGSSPAFKRNPRLFYDRFLHPEVDPTINTYKNQALRDKFQKNNKYLPKWRIDKEDLLKDSKYQKRKGSTIKYMRDKYRKLKINSAH